MIATSSGQRSYTAAEDDASSSEEETSDDEDDEISNESSDDSSIRGPKKLAKTPDNSIRVWSL